jgi:hypothetical protein
MQQNTLCRVVCFVGLVSQYANRFYRCYQNVLQYTSRYEFSIR